MKNKIAFSLKLAVTIWLFALTLRRIETSKLYAALNEANLALLLLPLALLWGGHLLCVLRWKALLEAFNIRLSYLRLIYMYAIGMFFSLFLPTVVGGDVVKFYLAGREARGSYTLAFASVFMDRNVGLFAMLALGLSFCFIYPLQLNGFEPRRLLLLTSAAYLAANALIFSRKLYNSLSGLIGNPPQVTSRLNVLSEAFARLLHNRPALAKALAISFANQMIVILVNWMIAVALGQRVPLSYFLVLIPIVNLATMLPISINGMGLREYAFLQTFARLGITPERSVLIGFAASLLVITSALPGGIAYLAFKRQEGVSSIEASKVKV